MLCCTWASGGYSRKRSTSNAVDSLWCPALGTVSEAAPSWGEARGGGPGHCGQDGPLEGGGPYTLPSRRCLGRYPTYLGSGWEQTGSDWEYMKNLKGRVDSHRGPSQNLRGSSSLDRLKGKGVLSGSDASTVRTFCCCARWASALIVHTMGNQGRWLAKCKRRPVRERKEDCLCSASSECPPRPPLLSITGCD